MSRQLEAGAQGFRLEGRAAFLEFDAVDAQRAQTLVEMAEVEGVDFAYEKGGCKGRLAEVGGDEIGDVWVDEVGVEEVAELGEGACADDGGVRFVEDGARVDAADRRLRAG